MRGGARPGAGRKPKTPLITARDFLGESLKPRDWVALNQTLWKLAREGNVRAAELLYRYQFGTPDKIEPPRPELPMIQFIEIPPIPPGGWGPDSELSEVKEMTAKDRRRIAKIQQMHRLKAEIEQDYQDDWETTKKPKTRAAQDHEKHVSGIEI